MNLKTDVPFKIDNFLVFKIYHKCLRTSANKHRLYLVRILSREKN